MKIFYLSASNIPSRAANSLQVMKMCNAFAQNGNKVILFARKQKISNILDINKFYGVNQCFTIIREIWPPIRGIGGIIYSWRIKRKILKYSTPDLFYGRDAYSLYKISSLGVPFIYESHFHPTNWFHRYIDSYLLNSDNLVHFVVTAKALKEHYLNLFPWLDNKKILVVANGADTLNQKHNMNDLKGRDYDLFEGRHSFKVGYVGSLYPGRGIDVIIKIASNFNDMDFHIVGGIDKDILYWKSICKEDNVIFHGFIPNKLLSKYYKYFDVLIAPYQDNGPPLGPSPLKIIEYLAAKKPIIASDLPLVHEVLKDGINSLLCPQHDIKSWVNALLQLRNNENMRNRLSNNAWKDFIKNYTWESRAKKVLGRLVNQ
jgi:glycosyltransferase involved in cell wall biosynthesis